MTEEYAQDLWDRARNALETAQALLAVSPDDVASRAYYADFNAASALFALQGRTFTKHTAVRGAVHRDLVRDGTWPRELGEAFDALRELRDVDDYGGGVHVSKQDAESAVEAARRVVTAVQSGCPDFSPVDGV